MKPKQSLPKFLVCKRAADTTESDEEEK